jgi:Domain of unknown function (DUF4391)
MTRSSTSSKSSKGLFDYPQKAAFGRVLPKSKIYAFAKATRRLRNLFAAEVNQIVWRFKLAPETTNLPAGTGVVEIQIFGLELKPGVDEPSEDILHCIDNAIAFPIFFEVTTPASGTIKVVTAYKRPSEADSSKCVVGDYFSTDWLSADTNRSPLPVALNLAGLYEQMLRQLMPIEPRPGESLQALAERHRSMTIKQRELATLENQLKREKQFNRKVEINAHVRAVKAEVNALTSKKTS